MQRGDARGGRGRAGASRVKQFVLRTELRLQPVANLVPAALVLRLFLAPDYFAGVHVLAQNSLVFVRGKGIELLEPDDGKRVRLDLAPRSPQVEIDLAAAQHDARYYGWLDVVGLIDQGVEAAGAEFFEARHGQGMAQQA